MNKKKQPSPYFQTLVDHINDTWKAKKGFGYPFQGKDFKALKNASRNFQEWGVMALWDVFMTEDSEFVKKSGYSLGAFFVCLPSLVDDKGWKSKAQGYESRICGKFPKDVNQVISNALAKIKNIENKP